MSLPFCSPRLIKCLRCGCARPARAPALKRHCFSYFSPGILNGRVASPHPDDWSIVVTVWRILCLMSLTDQLHHYPTSDVLVIYSPLCSLHKRYHICLPFKNMKKHFSSHKSEQEEEEWLSSREYRFLKCELQVKGYHSFISIISISGYLMDSHSLRMWSCGSSATSL